MLEQLLNVFIGEIGEDGTIVVPTFNFDFCVGSPFDINNTPGDGMGAFSEYVRTRLNAHRTSHPFHSVAAIGANAKTIADTEGYSEFSDDSFFDILLKLDCKILYFGVEFVTTFLHIAEERERVPYRFWKTFTGRVISGESQNEVTINFYARKLDFEPEPLIDIHRISQYLREKGIIRSRTLGSGTVSICDSTEFVGEVRRSLKSDPLFLLKKEEER
jgi:aminoglycoside 3-N-acetyltransferase